MKKIIVFVHIALLICFSNAHAMDWKILATNVSNQSVLLENKHTGTQKTMHKWDILNGGVIVEIKTHSVMIRDATPYETKNGMPIYGLREVRVSKKEPTQHILLSPYD